MVGNKYYKRYIERFIESMPTMVVHHKEIKTSDGYGGYTTEIEDVEYKVAMYDKTGRTLSIQQSGQVFTGSGSTSKTMLLTLPDVDLVEGELITIDDEEYRVYLVKSYFDICKQIEIEVVKRESRQ